MITPEKRPPPEIVVIDSDEDMLPATPPPPKVAVVSDEESPMIVGCRRLNPSRRNPLMTQVAQSTPVAPKKKKKRPAGGCSFIDREADVSSADDVDLSEDEAEGSAIADRYEGSFVDDQPSEHVNDT